MLWAEAGCALMTFILYVSGVHGDQKSICALKGSSVDLHSSAQYLTRNNKWYTVRSDGKKCVQRKLSPDGNHITHNTETSHPSVTISDLRESDASVYCYRANEDPTDCRSRGIELHVADLQVKVIPSTEGQTVTLMCNTSCALTEKPAAYIWYKNGEFLYEDWSPWYQQLVSNETSVTYSCAIKGYEHLTAPEVSVDSITPTCFSVTYAKGRMCSFNKKSEDEPCSITYPRDLRIQSTSRTTLKCSTSCPLIDSKTTYRWYRGGFLYKYIDRQQFTFDSRSKDPFSCAVEGHTDLLSDQVCPNKNCWSVDYVSRRICAVQGSSVNISSEYLHPDNQQPKNKFWYRISQSGGRKTEKLTEAAGRVEYHDNMKARHVLRLQNLKKDDYAEYRFRLLQDNYEIKESDLPGVFLIVTGLKVTLAPSAVVTEGQRVTLSCSTSCPLPDNTNYTWKLNSRHLTSPQSQNKHLVLDPVSSQHAGRYSCAVKTGRREIISNEKMLTVQTGKQTAAAAGVCAVLLVLILLSVCLWIRRKRTLSQSPRTESSGTVEKLNPEPVYEDVSAQPTEQEDLHYSRIHFHKDQTDPVYSTIQPHHVQEQEHIAYAVVNIRPKTNP